MGLIFPRDRRKNKGKQTGTPSPRSREAVIPVRLKNRPTSENVCEICERLKKGTTWNETLYGYVCRDKACRAIAKKRTEKEKKKQKQEERERRLRMEREAREHERSFEEEGGLVK